MKKSIMVIVIMASFYISNAQTKGTNTVGLGIGFNSQKSESNTQGGGTSSATQKTRSISLGYGLFVKDNERIGIVFSFGEFDYTYSPNPGNQNSTQKFYGGKASYQKYIPLLKKLYAFGGGRAGYDFSKYTNANNNPTVGISNTNSYSIGGYGGLTWFLSKRFAFETDLLSADVSYSKTKNHSSDLSNPNNMYTSTNTNFSLSTAGAINNLGFKIYLLF